MGDFQRIKKQETSQWNPKSIETRRSVHSKPTYSMVVKRFLSIASLFATLLFMSCAGDYFNWDLERSNPNDKPGSSSSSGTGGSTGSGGTAGGSGTGGTTGSGGTTGGGTSTGGTGGGTTVTILNDLNQIQFVDNTIAYAVGNGVVIKSLDGGITWLRINNSSSINFTAVYFVNASIGYLGGMISTTPTYFVQWMGDLLGSNSHGNGFQMSEMR